MPLPAEFRGAARVFRNEVQREDSAFERALLQIAAPLCSRLARHPRRGLRSEQMQIAAHSYRNTIPAAFRIGPVATIEHPHRFAISETRLWATWYRNELWEQAADEHGRGVCRFSLLLRDGVLCPEWHPVALVSLHALGRRLERSSERGGECLFRDLSVLATAAERAECVAAGDGFWIGSVREMKGPYGVSSIRSVRTWHE